MRNWLEFVAGATLALGLLAGCDDSHDRKPQAKTSAHKPANEDSRVAGLGADWQAIEEVRVSVWGFAASPSSPPASVEAIRGALAANMLPPRDAVRIADLLDMASATFFSAAGNSSATSGPRPVLVLTETPWNEDTMLLWVEIAPSPSAKNPGVSIEFDPKTVAAFRSLGSPSALPVPMAPGGGHIAVLYELLPQPEIAPGATTRYGTLHLAGGDEPITTANFVRSIEDAPDIVRFDAAVAGFGGLLRGDPAVRDLSAKEVITMAEGADRPDPSEGRAALIDMMRRAEPLIDLPPSAAPSSEEPLPNPPR
jgi:hypothetical protein